MIVIDDGDEFDDSVTVVIVINNLSLNKECATPFPGRAWLGSSSNKRYE